MSLELADSPHPEYTIVAVDRLRRVTARRMRVSVGDKPHVTLHRHAGLDALIALRQAARERLPEELRSDLTLTAVLVGVLARALKANNRLNGRVEEGEIRLYADVNIGVAVEVDGGLVVPVIRNAADHDFASIGAELKRLAHAARSGRLRPEEASEGTFTVSNLGAYGVEFFTPIINPPELAILGVGASVESVEIRDGELVTVRRLGLSLSFDHAASDGSDAARVLADLVEAVERPDSGSAA